MKERKGIACTIRGRFYAKVPIRSWLDLESWEPGTLLLRCCDHVWLTPKSAKKLRDKLTEWLKDEGYE